MKRVVIDLDAGADDAFALLLLLHAEKQGDVKVEAVVCSMGNSSLNNICNNVVRILNVLGRTDIPIYKGAKEAIIPCVTVIEPYYGKDGFGDLEDLTEVDLTIISEIPAAIAIRNLTIQNPKEITLVCIGPLTNTALAMKLYDDFAENIKEIFIMGGNYAAIGNVTEAAEYNFYIDPESAYIVLESAVCPITIVTWETCLFTDITFNWRFNELGSLKTPFIELLNKVERSIHKEENTDPNSTWYPCDAFLIGVMVYPDSCIERKIMHNATVELHGSRTRGQIVLDHLKKKEPNVLIIEKINTEFFKKLLWEAARQS